MMDQGGAAVAAFRLHAGLLQMDVDSKFMVLRKKNAIDQQVCAFPIGLKTKLKKLAFKTRLYKRPVRVIYSILNSERDYMHTNINIRRCLSMLLK